MRPSELIRTLDLLVAKQRPAFIWGPPGVGKSDIVAQLAAKNDMELRDIRLNLLDPVDLKGFPVPNHETKQMSWYAPDFLPPTLVRADAVPGYKPTKGAKAVSPSQLIPNPSKGILFLDELPTADRATQAAAYQLMLNRRIGDYVLPDGWSILAAGNRSQDRSVHHTMPAALANRLVHLDYDVSIDDFSAWAMQHDIKPEVLGFLRFKTDLLHKFDAANNPRAFPSPRSWMFVNQLVGEGLSSANELEVVKGTVGEGAAAEFMAFVKIARSLPTVDEIMVNPAKAKVPEEPSARFAITTSLATRASRDNFSQLCIYVRRLPVEFQVVFMRDSVRRNDDVSKTKAFNDWGIENSDVLI